MLISEEAFQREYGHRYQKALREAEGYVADPARLRAEIKVAEKAIDRSQLRVPAPDPYAYRMMCYRGFARFPERLKNFTIAQNEPRAAVRSFLPFLMDVEPASRCNFRCIMCTVSGWEKGKRADDLTLEDFEAFLDEHTHLVEMKIQGLGEPLLHRHFIDMIQLAVERYIWVRTTVNGSLLHVRDNCRRLIDSGVGEVQTSFDGATKEVFEKIRRNANFERVVQNFTLLNDYANRKDRLYTRMWVVVQKHNRHQIFEFVELAKQMGFRRLTFSVSLGGWGQDVWQENNQRLQAQDLTPEEQQRLVEVATREGIDISLWRSTGYTTNSPEKLCPAVFGRSSVSSDLRLVPCGMLGDPGIVDLGDARNFEEYWNGPTYRAFRQAHLNGKVPKCCRNCYNWDTDAVQTEADHITRVQKIL